MGFRRGAGEFDAGTKSEIDNGEPRETRLRLDRSEDVFQPE
jgi:hypothetical protein